MATIERVDAILDGRKVTAVIELERDYLAEAFARPLADPLDRWRANAAKRKAACELERICRHAAEERIIRDRQQAASVDWSAIDARIAAAMFEHADGPLADAVGKFMVKMLGPEAVQLALKRQRSRGDDGIVPSRRGVLRKVTGYAV
jgi:hypothetical protein